MSRTSAAAAYVSDSSADVYAKCAESLNRVDSLELVPLVDETNGAVAGSALAQSTAPLPSQSPSSSRSSSTRKLLLSEMSDDELLQGIRAESEPHFAELYSRYFQRIYNFVYARMRNHAESEEVVQETFLAVFRSFGKYQGQSSLLSWIYGIAKNTTNNNLRRAKSQTDRIDLADDEDLIPRPSLEEGMPDEQLDLHRFRELLDERLDSLADWQAEIFEMRHFGNLSIPEIAKRTQRSNDAIRSSLYRVKRIFFEAASANGNLAVASGGPAL